MQQSAVHILVVDDDLVDVQFIQRTLREHNIDAPLHSARNGQEALLRLQGRLDPPVPPPRLILLDLCMPVMDGLEFLAHLRGDPQLASTVVFVLSTSRDEGDRVRAYQYHVAGYIAKSAAARQRENLANLIQAYRRLVALPD